MLVWCQVGHVSLEFSGEVGARVLGFVLVSPGLAWTALQVRGEQHSIAETQGVKSSGLKLAK